MVVGGSMLMVFWLAPRFVVTTLMGQDYFTYANLLPRLGLAIFIVSALNMILAYYMTLKRYFVGVLAVVGVTITYGLMMLNHDSLDLVVNSLLQGTLLMAVLFVFWMGWRSRGLVIATLRKG